MPHYDFCCIATTTATTQRLTTLVRRVAFELQKRGGVVRKVEHYGLRPLAYPIKAHSRKHEVGRYFRIQLQTSPVTAEVVSEHIGNDESIIRHRHFTLPLVDPERKYKGKLLHTPALSEAHYDALRRTSNVDYFIARTLLKLGKVTPEEIVALGTHTPVMTPAPTAPEVLPRILPRPLVGTESAEVPAADTLYREMRDSLSMDLPGADAVDEDVLPADDPLRGLLEALHMPSLSDDVDAEDFASVAVPRASAPKATPIEDERARVQATHSTDVLAHLASRTEIAVDYAAAAQRSEGHKARAKSYFHTRKGDTYNANEDIARVTKTHPPKPSELALEQQQQNQVE